MADEVTLAFIHHGRLIEPNLVEHQYYEFKTGCIRIRTKGGQVYEGTTYGTAASVMRRKIDAESVDAHLRLKRRKADDCVDDQTAQCMLDSLIVENKLPWRSTLQVYCRAPGNMYRGGKRPTVCMDGTEMRDCFLYAFLELPTLDEHDGIVTAQAPGFIGVHERDDTGSLRVRGDEVVDKYYVSCVLSVTGLHLLPKPPTIYETEREREACV